MNLLFFHFHHPSSQIFRFQQFCIYFLTYFMVYFITMMWWFHFPEIYPVSGFISNLQISSQNEWFTSDKWYDDFLFQKFISFSDFYRMFSGFSSNLQIHFFYGLLCSQSKTLSILILFYWKLALKKSTWKSSCNLSLLLQA